MKRPFVLVFDNYQDVPSDASLHDVMREALDELPQRGRVIFISRGEPPSGFARLRAHQTLELLNPSALRFTAAEADQLIRTLAPRRLAPATRHALYDAASGWAAGLVLLLEQLRSQNLTLPARSSTPHRAWSEVLFDYFAGEIFDKLGPETKDVLLARHGAAIHVRTESVAAVLARDVPVRVAGRRKPTRLPGGVCSFPASP